MWNLKSIETNEKIEIKQDPNSSENKNTQVDKGLKALYIGQIEKNTQEGFKKLMESLSKSYESSEGDGTTCMIYNYYDKKQNIGVTSANEHILKDIQPAQWAQVWAKEEKNTKACIEAIEHMLDLSGFKQYLDKEQNKIGLTTNHDICCCITYYHNRAGDVKFHQDSLGAELFVSLIYNDSVYGPELKLKEKNQFEQRLKDIEKMMPVCFITTLKDLYEKVQKENNDVVEINKTILALDPSLIEWPGLLQGPGGIVAWVDELMVHTTPYMNHRQPNGTLLLEIIEKMESKEFEWKDKEPDIKYIKYVGNIIQEINKDEKNNHYITIYELKDKIKENKEAEEIQKVLNGLYAELAVWELSGRKSYNSYKFLLSKYVNQYNLNFNINRSLDDLLNGSDQFKPEGDSDQQEDLKKLQEASIKLKNLKKKGVEVLLSVSKHEIYGENSEYPKFDSTGFSKRRASIEFDKKESLIGAEEGKQRSFLRVWVIALPK